MRFTLRLLFVSTLACSAAGCSSVSYARTPAAPDVLDQIALKARERYSVSRVSDTHLELTDWWPSHSFWALGYSRFRADLRYEDGELDGDFYAATNGLASLYLPWRIDGGEGFVGGALKPEIRSQMDEILHFAGSSLHKSEVTHGVSRTVADDEPRPPRREPLAAPPETPTSRPVEPEPAAAEPPPKAESISQLKDLLERGVITQEEFEDEKNRILRGE